MTTATLEQTKNLKQRYEIGIPSSACHFNALAAFLNIHGSNLVNSDYSAGVPQIYQLDTSKGNHTYLVYQGLVYNTGVTFADDTYPNVDLPILQSNGSDVTVPMLVNTLATLYEDMANEITTKSAVSTPITDFDLYYYIATNFSRAEPGLAILTALFDATHRQRDKYPELFDHMLELFSKGF